MQIPLSATLTSQHKAHPAGAFSRETRQLLCPVGHLLYTRRHFAWQTLYKNKNHAQNKHPECQHCTHRKRQTKAFASQRRTARTERIPPDGFRELCLGQYIPPALSGISSMREPPLQRMWHAVRSESLGLTEKSLIPHDKKSPCLRRIPHEQGEYFL